jgi:predicted esterase
VSPPLALHSSVIERDGEQSRLLVLLHGYGEPVADLTRRLPLFDPDAQFLAVAPDAPFERRGRTIWHRALTSPDEAAEQFVLSLAALDAHLGELERSTGLAAADAVVGGFSQGGGMALGLLLGAEVQHRPAAGFGVCSFPPSVAGFRVDLAAASGRPFFLSSAHQDHFAPIEMSRTGAALLRDAGLDLTYVESDGGHEMTDEAALQVGAWIAGTAGAPHGHLLLDGVVARESYFDGLWDVVA